jgi:hypothetical protein
LFADSAWGYVVLSYALVVVATGALLALFLNLALEREENPRPERYRAWVSFPAVGPLIVRVAVVILTGGRVTFYYRGA